MKWRPFWKWRQKGGVYMNYFREPIFLSMMPRKLLEKSGFRKFCGGYDYYTCWATSATPIKNTENRHFALENRSEYTSALSHVPETFGWNR